MVATDRQTALASMPAVRKGFLHQSAARRARLGRVAGVHRHGPAPSLFRFVRYLPRQLSPGRIENGLAQLSSDHLADAQFRKSDQIILGDKPFGNVMAKIASSPGDSLIGPAQRQPSFRTVSRTALLPGQAATASGDFLF